MSSELNNILQLINDVCPQFQVTKQDLLHPTSSFVVRFYTNFLVEFQEKVQFLAGPYFIQDNFDEHLEIEDRLFQTMKYIFHANSLKFRLANIYDPSHICTKSFFKICCHLLSFAESILEEGEHLGSNILKMKEDTSQLEREQEEILLEVNKNATKKSELMEAKEKLVQELSNVKLSNEKMRDFRDQKQKKYEKKEKEIETLKLQLQQKEQELRILESKKKELSVQSISDNEHKNLLQIIENLKSELDTLAEAQMHIDDFLIHTHDVVLHYQDSIKRVPNVEDFDLEIVRQFTEIEEELKDTQIENEKLTNDEINPLKLIKMQNEKKLHAKKQYFQELSVKYQQHMKQYLKKKDKLVKQMIAAKEDFKRGVGYNRDVIRNLSQQIQLLEINMKTLKETFHTEYVKTAGADAALKDYFKDVLLTFNNLNF